VSLQGEKERGEDNAREGRGGEGRKRTEITRAERGESSSKVRRGGEMGEEEGEGETG